ncbi:hypothetical protein CEXT_627551, partial [Caerostris extrusa]
MKAALCDKENFLPDKYENLVHSKEMYFYSSRIFWNIYYLCNACELECCYCSHGQQYKKETFNTSYVVEGCSDLYSNETFKNDKNFKGAKYDWSTETQGLILSSFYYGYVVTQLPGGILCGERLGAKWIFGAGVMITSSLYLLIPLAASWGVGALIAIRILQGLGE